MLAGMGIVYVFLSILIIVTKFSMGGIARFDSILPQDAAKKAPAAKAAAPAAVTTAADSSFTPNEQTKRMLKRINDRRSYFDRKLREGNVIFFGTRYSPVSLDSRLVRSLLTVLPEALRDANDGVQLYAALRAKGATYISREVCDDLVENRQDYLQIIERRKEMEKNDELQNLLGPGARNSR